MDTQRQIRFGELIRSIISDCLLKEDFYNDCIGPRRFAKVKFTDETERKINEIKFS